MNELGIDTNSLANGWKKVTGEKFTKEEIVDLHLQMYNKVNNTAITLDDISECTSTSLSEISSTISSTVFNTLSAIDQVDVQGSNVELKKCYILNPENTSYLSGYYYLAVKLTSNSPFTVEQYKDIVKNGTSDNELSKKFDDEKARPFVNGVLNSVKKHLEEVSGEGNE